MGYQSSSSPVKLSHETRKYNRKRDTMRLGWQYGISSLTGYSHPISELHFSIRFTQMKWIDLIQWLTTQPNW